MKEHGSDTQPPCRPVNSPALGASVAPFLGGDSVKHFPVHRRCLNRGLFLAVSLAFVAQGCASERHHAPEMKAPPPAPPAREMHGEDPPVPESLRRLSVEVESLGTCPSPPRDRELARALRALANALELVRGAAPGERSPLKLRETAGKLESSSTSSLNHVELLKDALSITLQSLVATPPPPGRKAEYRSTVEALSRSIDALNPERALLDQWQIATGAFRAAADAVYLARGRSPAFGEAAPDGAPRIAVGSTEAELEEARADVLKLGQTRWPLARQAMGRALSSIADVVEACVGAGEQRDRISKIRYEAERLRSTDSMTFGKADWVKRGLTTALDALENQQGDQPETLAPWSRAARRAIDGIEERRSLPFQRAALQDGYRSTIDAFLAASQFAHVCH